MRCRSLRLARFGAILCGTTWLVLMVGSAHGQVIVSTDSRTDVCSPPPCPTPARPLPTEPAPPSAPAAQVPAEPFFSPERFAALQGPTVARADSNVGYIDNAIPRTQLRLRYDSAWDDNRPDRAEFLYPKCGCFRTAPLNAGFDPHAPGPRLPESRIDFQDIATAIEVAAGDRFSGFVEVPVRFLNPEQNPHTEGLGDMNAGFKVAVLAGEDQYLTFQFRTVIPTGADSHGLGTDHVSLEPALLLYRRLTRRLILEAELRDWIPIGGTDFAGNVIRYGVGLGYDVYRCSTMRITPVAEVVGWEVLSGKEFLFPENVIKDAAGDSIVNAKLGVRLGIGERSSFYAGYGRALTGEVWYKDIMRFEYRLAF